MNSKFLNVFVVHIDCDQLQVSVNMWRLFLRLQFPAGHEVWDTWWRTSPLFVKNFVSCVNILNLNRINSERYDVEGFRAPLEQTGKQVTCDLEGSRGHRLARCKHLIWSSKLFPDVRSVRTGRMLSGLRMWTGRTRQLWDGHSQVWQEVFLRCRLWTGNLSTSGSSSSSQVTVWGPERLMRRIRSRSADQRLQLQVGGGSKQLSLTPELLNSASHHPVVQRRTVYRRPLHLAQSADLAKVHVFRYHGSLQPVRVPPAGESKSSWVRTCCHGGKSSALFFAPRSVK